MSGYNRALVEHILPAVWDGEAAYGIKAEQVPDADMPRGHKDPKKGSPLFAHIADIKAAWKQAPLSLVEQQAVFLRFALDEHDDEIAAFQSVSGRAVRYRVERGVGKLAAHLNGEKYIDGYDQLEDEAA
ncbi:DNA binding protein [Streptomyces phage phiELB20]|uniref:DNA binding protein n=1 Tax=Streptomyces phage phiELB20 TaxID=1211278 RepID=I7A9J7_9CAUD|nr:sigma factor [Streptomyces phage phiELB20]AFO10911.1 DNA binding protein [Streptomyces phage phiELB20]